MTIIDIGWNLDNSYARLPKVFFSNLYPTPVTSPKMILLNDSLAASLGLNIQELKSNEGLEILAGNRIPEGSVPLAQAYAGHQFGHFTILGDGRALLLGEQTSLSGERFDIQLKGSGRTPYSRQGDGRSALGPMLREYIISESMQGLGISTTRSLAVVTTGETVIRETYQPGAILTRVASSHIRVGTFQYAWKLGSIDDLKALADYTIERHFPYINEDKNKYLLLLREVINRQAELIAKWQLAGFIHGVMNTDNMSISGETIDYGPCAFMDNYDPATVYSSIDVQGRYAYSNQPYIASWNLTRFAETLLPLFLEDQEKAMKLAQDELSIFDELFYNYWLSGMRFKLGIFNEEDEDEILFESLLSMMQKYGADYTNTFRALTIDETKGTGIFDSTDFKEWQRVWQARLSRQKESKDLSWQMMKNSNPAIIPRNHRVEEALESAVKQGDYSVMDKLIDVLSQPYAYSNMQIPYTALPEPTDCKYQTFCGT